MKRYLCAHTLATLAPAGGASAAVPGEKLMAEC
jgi:hypothetical protein